jgi:hemerythrin-like domain-containing protein
MIYLPDASRRRLIAGLSGAVLAAAGAHAALAAKKEAKPPPAPPEKKIGAVEELMRQHGVLRRVMLVYRQTATQLRAGGKIDPKVLRQAAQLFRDFGENFHERMLEQAYVFPTLRKGESPVAALDSTLVAQHDRGREITEYIRTVTGKGTLGDPEVMSRALESYAVMYANHAAREDTIVFPAWREALADKQLREMGETFEDIRNRQFGKDGFDAVVKTVAAVEEGLGLADLAQFTAPAPPRA